MHVMNLRVFLPDHILIEEEVVKINAEAVNGSFTLLPRHIDYVTALVPGLLSYETQSGEERFLAVNGGILVKAGPEVNISTMEATASRDLGELSRLVAEKYQALEEHEREAHVALTRLEIAMFQRLLELRSESRERTYG